MEQYKNCEPFYINPLVSAECVDSKDNAWIPEKDVVTYMYSVGNRRSQPTRYLEISMKPETRFGDGMMASIFVRTTKDYAMSDPYYVGSRPLGASSLSVKVDPDGYQFDGFTMIIVCCSAARGIRLEKENEKRRGPFTLLC